MFLALDELRWMGGCKGPRPVTPAQQQRFVDLAAQVAQLAARVAALEAGDDVVDAGPTCAECEYGAPQSVYDARKKCTGNYVTCGLLTTATHTTWCRLECPACSGFVRRRIGGSSTARSRK